MVRGPHRALLQEAQGRGRIAFRAVGKADWYVSGHRSWWSKTNRVPCKARKSMPMGQKMSGGLQLWMAARRPFLAA